MEVLRYQTASGADVFGDWLARLKDPVTRARIAARVTRLAAGNFGDCKPVGSGVSELRIHWGPGYRVYFAMAGTACVLLLCAGDKQFQATDIQRAIRLWGGFQKRTNPP
jgi:putative addiction module killer protein